MAGKNVVTKTAAAVAGAMVAIGDKMPDFLKEKQGTSRGNENVTTDDLVIPRLEILQQISPELIKNDPLYIKGAEAGQMINSVTKQVYGNEVFVVPVHFSKQWLVWRDRKKGGGFLGSFPNEMDALTKAEAEGGTKEGIEVMDTPTHYCLLVNRESGSVEEIMLSMPRTKAKISRQWNSMVKLAGGDRFSRVYRITTQVEENQKGKFYNYVVAQSGFPLKALYEQAEKLYTAVSAGTRKVTMDVKGMGHDEDSEL